MKIKGSVLFALTAAISTACVVHDHPGPWHPDNDSNGGGSSPNNNVAQHPAPPPPPPPPPPPQNKPLPPQPPPPQPVKPANVVIEPVRQGPPSVHPRDVIVPVRPANACLDGASWSTPDCRITCTNNPAVAQKCSTYLANYEPKIAATAMTCMNNMTAGGGCDANAADKCGRAALAQACVNPAVTQLCQNAAGPCKVNTQDCVNATSGLNAKGQAAVASCVAAGCGNGLYACIEGLTPAN
jgi:hypothetical protein